MNIREQLDDLLAPTGNNRIRVLHVLTRIAGGGSEVNTLYTCNGLDPKKYQVDVAMGEENEPAAAVKTGVTPHLRFLIVAGMRRDPSPFNDIRAYRSLRSIIRSGGYHIVHSHNSKAGFLARAAAAAENVPIIIHGIHGISFSPRMSYLERALYKRLERWVAKRTDAFVPVGQDLQNNYLAVGIGRPEQYHVIHSGMELDKFRRVAEMPLSERQAIRMELGIPTDTVVIGMISRMEPRKQHELFLQSINRIPSDAGSVPPGRSPVWILLAGDGPREEEIKNMVQTMGLADRTVFAGYRNDVERMFAACDIIALTSKWEGLPRVLVQAAACGLPAVSFEVDGAWEILKDGETGYIVPSGDVEALADRLGKLVQDRELREAMGQAAQNQVEDSWTVEAMVDGVEILYKSLLSKKWLDR